MQHQESKFSLKFRHWIMANPQMTGAYEIKDTRGSKTFRLAEWKEAQADFAEAIRYSDKGVLVRTEGATGLPDYLYLKQEPSWVVINFPEGFAIISGENLAFYKETHKTMTFEQASDIASIVV